ncbi:MAG: S41 family peptidase [Gemmatimonadaceae bacterium]
MRRFFLSIACVAIIAGVTTLPAQSPPSSPALPDTPVGRVFGEWLKAYNAADSAALVAYAKRYEPDMNLALAIAGREVSGGAELRSVERSDQRHVELVLRTRRTALMVYAVIDLSSAEPLRATTILTIVGERYDPDALQIDAAARATAIDSLRAKIDRNYVVPAIGKAIADSLEARKERGAYDATTNAVGFAGRLTQEIFEIAHDKHTTVNYSPGVLRGPSPAPSPGGPPSAPATAPGPRPAPSATAPRPSPSQLPVRPPCGYESKILDDNIGYVTFTNFRDPGECGADASRAMNAIAGARAVIFDLRRNFGGAAAMVPYLASYVFAARTHLHDVYRRATGATEEVWTSEQVSGPRFGTTKPVYILTSSLTISAAEAFAYDLQSLKRAIVVGETTAGAANMTASGQIGEHLMINVSIARAINPITGTNWEDRGVVPDIQVPASDALSTAQRLIRAIR